MASAQSSSTANRFARDLMVQEVGYAMLRSLGVTSRGVQSVVLPRSWTYANFDKTNTRECV
jgi:hypothetical protein